MRHSGVILSNKNSSEIRRILDSLRRHEGWAFYSSAKKISWLSLSLFPPLPPLPQAPVLSQSDSSDSRPEPSRSLTTGHQHPIDLRLQPVHPRFPPVLMLHGSSGVLLWPVLLVGTTSAYFLAQGPLISTTRASAATSSLLRRASSSRAQTAVTTRVSSSMANKEDFETYEGGDYKVFVGRWANASCGVLLLLNSLQPNPPCGPPNAVPEGEFALEFRSFALDFSLLFGYPVCRVDRNPPR